MYFPNTSFEAPADRQRAAIFLQIDWPLAEAAAAGHQCEAKARISAGTSPRGGSSGLSPERPGADPFGRGAGLLVCRTAGDQPTGVRLATAAPRSCSERCRSATAGCGARDTASDRAAS